MVSTIGDMCRSLLAEVGASEALALGVSSPGPIDIVAGALVDPPNLPLYNTVPLREMLQREIGIPVTLENDANAAAVAEHRAGLAQGSGNIVYVTLSTGIGAGIISDNRLVRGARGAAGEVGHIKLMVDGPRCGCGQKGCWESLASGSAIRNETLRRLSANEKSTLSGSDPDALDAQAVFHAAQSGDALANEVLDSAAYFTGLGLAAVVDVFNPEMVIVGGGLTQMGDRLLEPAFDTCRQNIFPLHERCLQLAVSNLGDDVSLVGALVLAEDLANSQDGPSSKAN